MIKTIHAQNVNDALVAGLHWLRARGIEEDSRNGPVIVAPGPVMTVYHRPWERVLFSAVRDANPFFHLFEALAFLAGENRVALFANYAKRMLDYSDDGEYLHGAYGFRWREWFGFDQLQAIINHLTEYPNSRRAVLTMWSPLGDMIASEGYGGLSSKDLPCNTQAYFRRRDDTLELTVMARSNDIVWGAYGANAVHFSVLHEYVARALGLRQGVMYQLSNDFHIYKSLPQFAALWDAPMATTLFDYPPVEPLLRVDERADERPEWFIEDCERLVASRPYPFASYRTAFFKWVALPMFEAHQRWRASEEWLPALKSMVACDWRLATAEWLERHEHRPADQVRSA
jgi:hypothetical protein